jgi:DNA-3-methyladenine glycosylase I
MTRELLTIGDDGIARCGWVTNDPAYLRYHDEEWGMPLHGDQALFEAIALEGFQAGLSWITILRRRAAFRAAFDDFEITRVALFDEMKLDDLAGDPSIIRNRQKIAATIKNARTLEPLLRADPGALDRVVWSHSPTRHARPRTVGEVLGVTELSTALSTELRALGLTFVGPTTMHALMQSAGLINDHAVGCVRGDELEAAGYRAQAQ